MSGKLGDIDRLCLHSLSLISPLPSPVLSLYLCPNLHLALACDMDLRAITHILGEDTLKDPLDKDP